VGALFAAYQDAPDLEAFAWSCWQPARQLPGPRLGALASGWPRTAPSTCALGEVRGTSAPGWPRLLTVVHRFALGRRQVKAEW